LPGGVAPCEGPRTSAAGSRLPIPAGAQVIDLGDATILPGFIDAHTHVTDESSDDWNADAVAGLRRTVPESTLRAAEVARRTLMAGFTTVRDVGSGDYIDVGLRNAITSGVTAGPRMRSSAQALGARGGHCDNTGFPYQKFGPEPGIAEGIATGPEQFRDAVRFQIKYGADVIKVCATGGVLSLGDDVGAPQLTQAEMDALLYGAHRRGRGVAAHAHGAEGAKVAVRAGIDSIEHGSFLDDEVVKMMKERGPFPVAAVVGGGVRGRTQGDAQISARDRVESDTGARRPVDGVQTRGRGRCEDRLRNRQWRQSSWPQRRGIRAARRARTDGCCGVENRANGRGP